MPDLVWPSSTKLQSLREEGKVAYSPFATAVVLLLLVGLTLVSLEGQYLNFFAELEKLWGMELSSQSLDIEIFKPLLKASINIFLVLCGSAVVGVLCFGMCQTRFLFCPGLVSFDLSKLNRMKSFGLLSWLGRMVQSVLLWIVFVGAALMVGRYWLSLTLPLFNNDLRYLLSWPKSIFSLVSLFLLVTGILGVLGSWILSRFIFLCCHRMTRQEMEQEIREGD